jgi:hypothetical protein
MKQISFLLALALCLPLTAHADEASRQAKAKEMLAILHMDKVLTQIIGGMERQMDDAAKQMASETATPDEEEKLAAFQKNVYKLIEAQVNWKVMEPEYINLYAKTFSDEEFDSILSFYKSPAGVAMVEKLPMLTSQAMQLTQTKMATLQPQLKQMVDDFVKSSENSSPMPAGISAPK